MAEYFAPPPTKGTIEKMRESAKPNQLKKELVKMSCVCVCQHGGSVQTNGKNKRGRRRMVMDHVNHMTTSGVDQDLIWIDQGGGDPLQSGTRLYTLDTYSLRELMIGEKLGMKRQRTIHTPFHSKKSPVVLVAA